MPDPVSLLDERDVGRRVEFAVARAEVAWSAVAAAQAEVIAAVTDTVAEAAESPALFVIDPTAADAVEFAQRAAVADLAVRLCVSEATIRSCAHQGELMKQRTPQCWALFRDGELSVAHARIVSELVAPLPRDVWAAFDEAAVAGSSTSPARFRSRMRLRAARLDAATLTERHTRAAADRRVWVEHTADGMAWLGALLPAADAHRVFTTLDRLAADLTSAPDEARTLAQARADILVDLVAGDLASAERPRTTVSVAVTVPVMTLLGHTEEPGTLDGIHPIDADTARRLAGHATSFTRILTHPVSGVAIAVDRGTYRVPADLARWVRAVHPTCTFPGCNRRSRDCDLDHTHDFARGGVTSGLNLSPLCRHHHRIRHHTRWRVHRPPARPYVDTGFAFSLAGDSAAPAWTSPTGHRVPGPALPERALPSRALPDEPPF